MKKTLFVIALCLSLITACSSKEKGTHRHPDGRVHANHDSTKAVTDTTKHGHSHDGDGHTHE